MNNIKWRRHRSVLQKWNDSTAQQNCETYVWIAKECYVYRQLSQYHHSQVFQCLLCVFLHWTFHLLQLFFVHFIYVDEYGTILGVVFFRGGKNCGNFYQKNARFVRIHLFISNLLSPLSRFHLIQFQIQTNSKTNANVRDAWRNGLLLPMPNHTDSSESF